MSMSISKILFVNKIKLNSKSNVVHVFYDVFFKKNAYNNF